MRKDFGGRRLVIGDAARDRTVQSDVIAEDEMPPGALLHHDQPAVRPDVDGDRVPLAIASNRVHEDPLTGWSWFDLVRWMAALQQPQH